MTDKEFLLLAIEAANKSQQPVKCGVVIVKDGEVIVRTHNRQRADNDPTAHAEILALRNAGKIVGDKNLPGCEMFCSCEPCSMCLSAVSFTKITRICYAAKLEDTVSSDERNHITSKNLLDATPWADIEMDYIWLEEAKDLYPGIGALNHD